ncbi:aldo/keto reductase [Fluviispira multicolorata]|uniref:NADP-dependent oxidoreductase domain-containing protein n=1 Tax=Fluviispira multicolorata TaxID=2654512 RepID=A0A833N0Q2_9BACT|nr:aldo/keto reductase [Fluviispira multicolorata]KAB8029136.1 hypothetical protein GCL57_11395 [Fluviispira multicolorata]
MIYRSLGKNLQVSALGFGGAALSGDEGGYGFGKISDEKAHDLLQYAYEKGVTLFDTAPIYGFGNSEKRIGRSLSGVSQIRKKIILVSKLGATWNKEKVRILDNSPDSVKRMLSESLENLKTDYLDLYMIHWPDAKNPLEKTMEALLRAKEEGLIRNIGVCNFDEFQLSRALNVGNVDVLQNPFSMLDITAKNELFTFIKERNIGFMAYGTLAKGMLSGSFSNNKIFDSSDVRSLKGKMFEDLYNSLSPLLKSFFQIAKECSLTPAQLALAWVLSHEEVGVALCGAKSIEQLDDLINQIQYSIPAEAKHILDKLSVQFKKIRV